MLRREVQEAIGRSLGHSVSYMYITTCRPQVPQQVRHRRPYITPIRAPHRPIPHPNSTAPAQRRSTHATNDLAIFRHQGEVCQSPLTATLHRLRKCTSPYSTSHPNPVHRATFATLTTVDASMESCARVRKPRFAPTARKWGDDSSRRQRMPRRYCPLHLARVARCPLSVSCSVQRFSEDACQTVLSAQASTFFLSSGTFSARL